MRHFRALQTLLKRFHSDERGAFLVLFAILSIVLIATAGAVVDFTTIEQSRTRAQDALDSAALGLQSKMTDDGVTEETLIAEAQGLLTERLAAVSITGVVTDATIDEANGTLTLEANITVPTAFVALVGVSQVNAELISEVTRGTGANLEVALVLDVTGSMAGSRLTTLKSATHDLIDTVVKDKQTPVYSKVAIVPFSMGVNVGEYFDAETATATTIADVRGPVKGATPITGAAWRETPTIRTISAINKANPARITTTTAHGLANNAIVYLSGISGGGFTALNNRWFRIGNTTATTFTLTSVSSSGFSGSYTANSGTVTIWGSARMGSAITKANGGRITTTAAHNLVTGDAVYVTDAAGGGFTALNGRWYNVTVNSTTQFTLNGTAATDPERLGPGPSNTTSYSGTYTANSAIIRKCLTTECEVVVTSPNHGMDNDDYVYITGVGGMTQINNNDEGHPTNAVSEVTTNTFVLEEPIPDAWGPSKSGLSVGAYTSGGQAQCMAPGCRYYYFESNDTDWNSTTGQHEPDWKVWEIDDECVTERIGANEYTDAEPTTTWVGEIYLPIGDSCPLGSTIFPLSTERQELKDAVTAFVAEGTTAGHIGIAWGWYMLSPNFGSLWPAASQPAAYGTEDLKKIAVIMTDGVFNTAYCDGVLSQDSTGSGDDQNNCNASNGAPEDQARDLCAGMKAPGVDIEVYTVGFQLNDPDVKDMLEDCATDAAHYFDATNNDELKAAFAKIGDSISDLRLAK